MRILRGLGEVWFVMALVATLWAFAAYSQGATTSKRTNSLGFVQYTTNPLMYQAGSIAEARDAVASVDGNLNLRIKPLGTYMLYDESILFCGMPIDKFRNVREPFVITYERVAHHSVQGLGCHNLVRVDALEAK